MTDANKGSVLGLKRKLLSKKFPITVLLRKRRADKDHLEMDKARQTDSNTYQLKKEGIEIEGVNEQFIDHLKGEGKLLSVYSPEPGKYKAIDFDAPETGETNESEWQRWSYMEAKNKRESWQELTLFDKYFDMIAMACIFIAFVIVIISATNFAGTASKAAAAWEEALEAARAITG